MNHFPVTASVLSATALATLISEQYNLKDVNCTLLKTFVNDSYHVSAGQEQFIFRVYTRGWRSELEINEEIRMILTAHQNDVGVSYPIMDTAGSYTQKMFAPEGDRFGVLFSFANGNKIFNVNEEQHRKLGEYLAELHRATADMKLHRVDYDAVTLLVYSYEKIQKYLKRSPDEEAFMLKTKQLLLDEFKKIKSEDVRKGGVHLDFWPDNFHIDSAGNVTLFDFDFCGTGFQVLDIAFYLTMLQGLEHDENNFHAKTSAFITGYEEVTKLSEEEKRIIPILGSAISFYYMGVQSDRFATIFFNEDHLKRFINIRLKRWMISQRMI